MGASFSPSDAALEGFGLLKRHWRAAVGWALANLVAWVGLGVLLVVALVAIVPFAGSEQAAGTAGSITGAVLFGLGAGAVELVILCAMYRAELRPEAPGFLHMRLGRDELRVLGAVLLLAIVAIPLVIGDLLLARFVARAGMGWGVLAGLAGLAAIYAGLLRLALTPVIAFAEGRIGLADSWRRTRGQTWRLIGMAVLLIAILLLMAFLISVSLFLISGFATGFRDFGLSGEEALQAHPGRWFFELAVQLMLVPFWMVLGQAPWIAVYRALRPQEAA